MVGRTYRYWKGDLMFPFGYGLSYTTFHYSGLSMAKKVQDKPGQVFNVSVVVANTGMYDGEEVGNVFYNLLKFWRELNFTIS